MRHRRWDLFVSHAWAEDGLGRDTHARAVGLARAMMQQGWRVWVDQEELVMGHLDAELARGIEASTVVLVCLTRSYMDKVGRASIDLRSRDNCLKEWNCAVVRRKIMVPLIFEPSLLDPANWPAGVISMHLGTHLYVDATEEDWCEVARRLGSMLRFIGVAPSGRPAHLLRRKLSFRRIVRV